MQLVLGPIVGHVGQNSARIWLHTDQTTKERTISKVHFRMFREHADPIDLSY